jgi:hypothetical protein
MAILHFRSSNWDIPLNFDHPEIKTGAKPLSQIIPFRQTSPATQAIPAAQTTSPRELIGQKFPKILDRIELLWGSMELHNYLEHTILTDRSGRQGFPDDVMQALIQIHAEHTQILKQKKMICSDLWDI